MKHIKIFNEHQDYVNLNNNEISYCIDNEEIHYTNIHNNYIDHFICIDEMPMGCVEYSDAEGEHEEWSEDYYDYEVSKEDYILNYFLPLARNPYNDLGTNIYKYVGEYEYDSEKFYMWKHIKNNDYQIDDNILYILTYQKSFKGLTVRDDINNRFNPIFATLKYDKSITLKIEKEETDDTFGGKFSVDIKGCSSKNKKSKRFLFISKNATGEEYPYKDKHFIAFIDYIDKTITLVADNDIKTLASKYKEYDSESGDNSKYVLLPKQEVEKLGRTINPSDKTKSLLK